MTGESKQIAERVAEWIIQRNLNTFQGGNVYEGKSAKGAHYWAVDMGTPRTMDGTIQIYNKNFIVTNISTLGRASFKSESDLMEYLNQSFKIEEPLSPPVEQLIEGIVSGLDNDPHMMTPNELRETLIFFKDKLTEINNAN